MIRWLLFLILLTAIAIGMSWFVENDGSVIIEWMGQRIQTSVSFISLASVIGIVLFTLCVQVSLWLINIPKRLHKKLQEQKKEKGLHALTEGFVAIAAGDTKSAKSHTKKAADYLGTTPLTSLLGAQTAQAEGNAEEAKKYYTAMLENKETEVIAIKGLLLQAKQEGDLQKAEFLAEKALSLKPGAEWPLSVLIDIYKITGQWDKAEEKLLAAWKKKQINDTYAEHTLALILFIKSKKALITGQKEQAVELIRRAWEYRPEFPPYATTYANLLVTTGNRKKAISVLEKSWKKLPHPDTGDTYIKLFENESLEKRLKYAGYLIKLAPESIEGHRAAARLAMESGKMDLARKHIRDALELEETKDLCHIMMELERLENPRSESTAIWNSRKESAFFDPHWICSNCDHSAIEWDTHCPHCQHCDSIEWKTSGTLPKTLPHAA